MSNDSLADFVEELGQGSHLKVEEDLGDGFVRLRRSEAERRQAAQDIQCSEDIVIEILRNSRDARARNIFLALTRSETTRTIVCIDDGDGIPEHMQDLVFDARVTSKLTSVHMDKWGIHGRGMALYAVRENSRESSVVVSSPGRGTSLRIETDLTALPEKADQSSFPQFSRDEKGVIQVRGIKNIVRTACEFALEHRKDVNVYVGSPIEIAATLYDLGFKQQAGATLFETPYDDVPYCWRPAFCTTPRELTDVCEMLGLVLSERSARRILDEEVDTVASMTDLVRRALVTSIGGRSRAKAKANRAFRPKITKHDMDEFKRIVKRDYRGLAQTYYLNPDVDIDVAIRGGNLKIDIPLRPDNE